MGREGDWAGFPANDPMMFKPYCIHERSVWQPCTDIYESDQAFIVKMELAGIDPQSLAIIFEDGLLTVRGERPELSGHRKIAVRQLEIPYGPFERRVEIGTNIDAQSITASWGGGFLELVLPKVNTPSHVRIVVHIG